MDFSFLPKIPQAGWFTKILVRIAGADFDTLLKCPESDWSNVRAVAEIMLFSWTYQTVLFSGIAHRVFAGVGRFHPEFVLAAMFLATFVLLIDSYMVMRSGWHLSGISELKRGGLDLGGSVIARIKVGVFFTFRILLSVGIAQLTAIFFGLIVFADDVETRMNSNVIATNAPIIAAVTARVDDEIAHAREATAAQATRIANIASTLDALRQKEINPPAPDLATHEAEAALADLRKDKSKADEDVLTAQVFASNDLAGIKNVPGNSGQVGEGVRYRAAMEQVTNAKSHATELTKALETAQARIDALRAQVNAKTETIQRQTHEQISAVESALVTERKHQTMLDADLAELMRNRDAIISHAVENAPNYARRRDGMLAQIDALEQIAHGDPTIAMLIVLIDLVSFGFELAGVLSKITSFVPTTYAALLASDAYLQSVKIVDDMLARLNQRNPVDDGDADEEAFEPANDNVDETVELPELDSLDDIAPPTVPIYSNDMPPPPPPPPPPPSPSPPPKRGRGRPRKQEPPTT